ncbi:energy-coupled thiamine transporter ThiT [Aerococcaceae bacterium NML201209]|nr:energy-coupled thiamine transporter ThiT [Aerococcaceae bacterium NML201209]MCW6666386.1 energy-coupled thiamine transporter ThiT [Aerococcaceae bacterium NML190938]MCW6676987.1 energy-coupled thiamine transporter ThiT [Aerococcaceae bacterium NML180378]MCW6680746.1 energy-coupled thiamine transporter ThiT [Aerococcaceae bacterium NML130460]
MNARTIKLLQEMLLAIVISVGLEVGAHYLSLPYMALSLLPLIWLALRYSGATAVIAGAVAGLTGGLILYGLAEPLKLIVLAILPVLVVGVAGFFAKYTQKTLNNRRLSSTYLNIVTATVLVAKLYYAIRFGISPLALGMPSTLVAQWLGVLVTIAVISIVLCVGAKLNAKLIIPKRSKYLSRKETSILLND